MIPIMLVITIAILIRNFIYHRRMHNRVIDSRSLKKSESKTVQGIISESSDNVNNVIFRSNKIFATVIQGLSKEDSDKLKKSKKQVKKLDSEIEDLRDNIFYFIKNLDETSVRGSNFYMIILAYLTDIAESLNYISSKSYKHVNNQHKKLKFNQLRDLTEIKDAIDHFSSEITSVFKDKRFGALNLIIAQKDKLNSIINEKINAQIDRTRNEESSPKNTTLYFNILLETKDLLKSVFNLIDEYSNSYKKE